MGDAKSDDEKDESGVDATGATPDERRAKEELFEAIDHFKNAASILFDRARNDRSVRSAGREARRILEKVSDGAEPLAEQVSSAVEPLADQVTQAVKPIAKQVAGAAEPLAKQLAGEISRLTRSVLDAVEPKPKERRGKGSAADDGDDGEE